MADVADTTPGAARQSWRAASAVLVLAVVQQVAFERAPGAPQLADFLYNLAFAGAGFAATRLMLRSSEGAVGRLVEAWAVAIRRGLPALGAVMIAVLALSVVVLPPADLKNQAWTALWTALGSSGGELMKQGPFDPAMSSELLLHLWATGVAAQLFASWTVVVAVVTRLRLTRWIGALAGLGVLLSLALEVWMRGKGAHPHAFYLAPANVWPFLIGALYASEPPVPGRQEMCRRSRLSQFSDLAWPFYLWLWPLMALPRMILARSLSVAEMAAVLAAAVVAALATRRWIETPVRRRLGDRPGSALAAGAAAAVAVALLSGTIFAADGLPGRVDARLLAEEAAIPQSPGLHAVCNVNGRRPPPMATCTTPPGGPADVIVWGNSHAANLTPAVLDWTSRRGLRMRQVTKSGCLPLLVTADGLADADCLAFNRAAVEEMAEGPEPRLVILGAAWTVLLAHSPGDDAAQALALERDLAATVRRVRAAVGPEAGIVLLGTTPDFAFAPAACHSRRRFLGLDTGRCDLAPPANATLAATMHGVLTRVAQGQPGVHVFDPAVALCRYGRCRTRSADGPWYADSHHLTPAGGLAQAEALADVLDAASVRR